MNQNFVKTSVLDEIRVFLQPRYASKTKVTYSVEYEHYAISEENDE